MVQAQCNSPWTGTKLAGIISSGLPDNVEEAFPLIERACDHPPCADDEKSVLAATRWAINRFGLDAVKRMTVQEILDFWYEFINN